MSKLARACAVAVAVATSLAGGSAAAQIQGGVARKAAPPAIALGVPVAKVTSTISQRSSSRSTLRSGSALSFASGQPALRYQAADLPTAKDPVRREAVKDGAKEAHVSARGAGGAGAASNTGEFAPAPGVLRANMPPVTFADAERVLKTRVLPTSVNQGVTAAPKTGKTSTLARMKIAGDAAASGPASIAELARALRNHPDLIYQYVRNNVEYYPTFGLQKGALGAVLDNQATAHDQAALMVELLRASGLEANRPSVIQENGSVNLASYAYDDLGRRTTVTLGNGTTVQRAYDNQGALATLKNFLASPSQEVQYTYTRNQLRELKSVAWTNNLYQWSGASPGTKSYTSNGLNQYTAAGGAAQSYDANGNLTGDGTWSYGYDLDNRLKTASKTGTAATLSYDAEGRLRQTAIGTTTTNLLYDATNLIAEYDAAGTTLQRRYVHGPGTDEPIVWYEGSGTTAKNWFYADHLGSIVATANATGASTGTYSYGPYGEPNTTTGPRFRYTGQQLIGELGLYHYKARFYSPGLGRFLQTDPIGYKDDVNLYAYVGGNPVNRTDPSGLIAREAVELAAGLGGAISSGWSASVAAFQNESLVDMALKTVEGLNPTVGAAAGAGVKLLGAADEIAYAAMGAVDGLGFTRSQLQHAFKHAKDFGVGAQVRWTGQQLTPGRMSPDGFARWRLDFDDAKAFTLHVESKPRGEAQRLGLRCKSDRGRNFGPVQESTSALSEQLNMHIERSERLQDWIHSGQANRGARFCGGLLWFLEGVAVEFWWRPA